MAHARRRFVELHLANKSTLAGAAIEFIGQLYGIERDVKDLPAEERLRERRTRAAPVAQALYRWLLEFRPKVKSQPNVARAARCTSSLLGADGRTIDALRLLKKVGAVVLLDEFTRCDGSARSGAKASKSLPACSSFLFSQRACCNGCTATLCRQSVDFVAGHLLGSGSVPSCAWDKPPLERKPHIPTCLLTAKFKAHFVQTACLQSVRRSAMPVGLRSSTGPMSQDGHFSCRDGELNALRNWTSLERAKRAGQIRQAPATVPSERRCSMVIRISSAKISASRSSSITSFAARWSFLATAVASVRSSR